MAEELPHENVQTGETQRPSRRERRTDEGNAEPADAARNDREANTAALPQDVEAEASGLEEAWTRNSIEKASFTREASETPNDPKLSDCGGRRGSCMAGGKAAAEAATVTPGAVRCSAWLGDVRSG